MKRRTLLGLFVLLAALVVGCGADPGMAFDGRYIEVYRESDQSYRVVDGDRAWHFAEPGWQVRSVTGEPVTAGDKDFVLMAVREWQRRNPPHSTGKLLGGLALMGLGLFSIIKPQTVWYVSQGWKFRNAEPSDAAILLTVVSGVAAVVIGLVIAATW